MKLSNVLLCIFTFCLLLLMSCSQESDQQQAEAGGEGSTPEMGDHAAIIQNAVFTDLDGNPVDLSEYHGKLVLIDFWESWCGPCLQVFPAMQELREEYPDQFEMLAVTVGLTEGPEEARAFAAENEYDFTWLYDANGVFEELGGTGIPFKVYVDPDGELLEIEMGSRGRQGDYDSTKTKIQQYF